MAPRSIALSEEEGRIVDDLVGSGRFRDAAEVVREGLRLVAEDADDGPEDENFGYTLDELKAEVQLGLDDMANGRYVTFTDPAEMRAYLEALAEDVLSGKSVS